jgi:hypothetical protein
LRKHVREDVGSDWRLRVPKALLTEAARFYVFFGKIEPERFRAIDETHLPLVDPSARLAELRAQDAG